MQNQKDFIKDLTNYMKMTAEQHEHTGMGMRNLDWPSDELAAFNLDIAIQDARIINNKITKH
jgi:hypothetical protein